MKKLQLLLFAITVFLFPSILFSQWTSSKLIQSRGEMASFSMGSKVFFAGGSTTQAPYSDEVAIYDTETRTWTQDTLERSATDFTVIYNDKWAILYGGSNTVSGYIQIYNALTQKWEAQSEPFDLFGAEMDIIGDKLIYRAKNDKDTIIVYDIPTKKYLKGAKLSAKRSNVAKIIQGSKIIYVGGTIGCCDESDAIDIFDVQTNTVVSTKMSEKKYDVALGIVNNKLLILGGRFSSSSGFKYNSSVANIVDLSSLQVTPIDTKIKTAKMLSATLNNKVVFYNGEGEVEFPSSIIYNDSSSTWTYKKLESSKDHYAIKGAKIGNKLILAGAKSFSSNVYIYDAMTDTWTNKTLSVPRFNVGLAVANNLLVIAGGETSNSVYSDEVDIFEGPSGPLTATIEQLQTIKCYDDKTAVLTLKKNGGKAPFTYKWNTGSTDASISNIGAGTYSVTVTDADGNKIINSIQVMQPTKLVLTTTSKAANPQYKNGNATVTVTGGTTPFSYKWSTSPIQTTPVATNLGPGNYNITVTDNNGCSIVSTVSVSASTKSRELLDKQQIVCYPNPTKDYLHIDIQNIEGLVRLEVLDMQGKVLLSKETVSMNNNISISEWNNGAYIVKCIYVDNKFSYNRFIIQK